MSDERKPTVEIIHRVNRLKAKVGGTEGVSGRIDPQAIAQAQRMVDQMAGGYRMKTEIDLSDLVELCGRTRALPPAERQPHLREIDAMVDQVMGLGGTFGYDLVTRFAKSLRDYLATLERPTDPQMLVVQLHIEAMQAVIREKILGDGGTLGQELAHSLALAIRKVGGA